MDCAAGEAAFLPLLRGIPERVKSHPQLWFHHDKLQERFRVPLLTCCACRSQLNDLGIFPSGRRAPCAN